MEKVFSDTLLSRQRAKDTIKQMEIIVGDCDKTLQELLDANSFERVTCQGYTVSRREGSERRTLDPVKLLEMGVPASTIEACTKITKVKSGISVRQTGDRDDFTEWVRGVREEVKADAKDR